MNNKEKLIKLKNKATGIGSIPHTDINAITDLIIQKCPDIPYWPQAVNIDPREGMMQQFTENLPCIKINDNNDVVYDDSVNKDGTLLEFFENLTSNNYDYYKIGKDYARGFYSFLDKLKSTDSFFAKGQVVGPVTFLYSIMGEDGKPILFDDMLCDAIVRGLAMKGVWQAKKLKAAGKIPVIFFDEPAMSGFGSAFMALDREKAMNIFDTLVDTAKEHEDVIVGMHCCGNSDWEMLLQTKIDIINFDAFSFSENFILYSDAINKFLNRGGLIAWGAVPTSEYNEKITFDTIIKNINNAFDSLSSKDIDMKLLVDRSIFTPACGMGNLSKENAESIIDLTYKLAEYITSL